MSFRSPSNNERGFTLLEMIIVMAIMVAIAFGIYNVTTEVFKLRDVLQVEGDFYNEIRLSVSIMQRDISLLYSPVIMLPPELQNPQNPTNPQNPNLPPTPQQAQQQAQLQQQIQSSELGQMSNYWLTGIDLVGIRPSRFTGLETKLSFISMSHQRIYKESGESDFAKVSYEIKKDEKLADMPAADKERLHDTYVLVRTEDADAFDMDDTRQKGDPLNHVFALLHGIKTLKYRYYAKNTDTWYPTWDNSNPDFQNRFPDMIELTVEVLGPQNLSYSGIYIFRPEIPLRGLDPST